MRNLLLTLILSLLTTTVLAEDFYWYGSGTGRHDTPLAACSALLPLVSSPKYVAPASIERIRDNQYSCLGMRVDNGLKDRAGVVNRLGTGCTSPAVYNPQTLGCEKPQDPNKCAAGAGATSKFNSSGTAGDGKFSLVGQFVVGPNEMCYDGCAVVVTGVKGRFRTDGIYRVWGTKTKTGAECGAGGVALANGDPNPAPDPVPPIDVDQKPCVYKTNPDGTQSCDSHKYIDTEGHYCGQVNGEDLCVSSPASKNGINISTNISKTPNGDGTFKVVKTDVTTKTSCTPVNKCSTSSTTRTTTSTIGGDGKVISVVGTCKGKDCSSQNTDPDGNGSGAGTCTGSNCSDDPFEEGMGEGGFYEPGDDTFESVLTGFQSGVSQLPVIEGVGNFLSFNPSGSCPTGSTSIWIFTIQVDQWCGASIPWDLIRAVIMGAAAFLAFRFAFL